MHAHTHTDMHTGQAHVHGHAHTDQAHIHQQAHTHTQMCTQARHMYTDMHTYTDTHTGQAHVHHGHTYTWTCTHTWTCMHTGQAYIYVMDTRSHTHGHAHRPGTCTKTCAHTGPSTPMYLSTPTHGVAPACTDPHLGPGKCVDTACTRPGTRTYSRNTQTRPCTHTGLCTHSDMHTQFTGVVRAVHARQPRLRGPG